MKFQAIVLASFLVMPYALADDQWRIKNRMQRHRRLMQ